MKTGSVLRYLLETEQGPIKIKFFDPFWGFGTGIFLVVT